MGVNKVEYGGRTLIDLTGDTVTPQTLIAGITAHAKNGEKITGTNSGKATTTLLWENNTTGVAQSAFTANLSQSLTNFDAILITTAAWRGSGDWSYGTRRVVGYLGAIPAVGGSVEVFTAAKRYRKATRSSNTAIAFTNGYEGSSEESRGCIIRAIYGIKNFSMSGVNLS